MIQKIKALYQNTGQGKRTLVTSFSRGERTAARMTIIIFAEIFLDNNR